MKIKAAIFTILYLFFFFQYMQVWMEKSVEKGMPAKTSCCKKMKADEQCNKKTEKPQKESSCKDCTAFMFCPFCIYTIPVTAFALTAQAGTRAVNTINIDNSSISSFSSECWHPPEEAAG